MIVRRRNLETNEIVRMHSKKCTHVKAICPSLINREHVQFAIISYFFLPLVNCKSKCHPPFHQVFLQVFLEKHEEVASQKTYQ